MYRGSTYQLAVGHRVSHRLQVVKSDRRKGPNHPTHISFQSTTLKAGQNSSSLRSERLEGTQTQLFQCSLTS